MTSALYLENYLDGLEHLPAELRRNFYLMRELDNRVQTLMKTIDKECNDFMGNISADSSTPSTEDGRKDKLKAIQDMFNKTKQLGDDKVGLIQHNAPGCSNSIPPCRYNWPFRRTNWWTNTSEDWTRICSDSRERSKRRTQLGHRRKALPRVNVTKLSFLGSRTD